jgi:1-acyl-sn-glycerol-3-phosphate acyltransferase
MSNVSFATELPAVAAAGDRKERGREPTVGITTPLGARAVRLAHLLVVVVGLYLVARFGAHQVADRSALGRRWAQRFLRSLRVEVRARGHLPAVGAPVLLVANHVSWLDSYALNTLSAARFVAKSEVREWPLIGVIATCFGTFFLRRGCFRAAARAVATLTDALCAPEPVAVFPEGTTSTGGGVLHFYPALFQAAVLSGARVQPVAIRYRGTNGRPTDAAAYVGDMSVLASVRRMVREPRLTVELIFCAPLQSAGRTRKELAAAARTAIVTALEFGSSLPFDPQRDSDMRAPAAA